MLICPSYYCSEDEEEIFNRIFASSDSESDFEKFVAQKKRQTRRPSERTDEEVPTPQATTEKPSKPPKRGRHKLKPKKEVTTDDEKDDKTPVVTVESETKLKSEDLEVDKENRNKEKVVIEEIKVVPKPVSRRAQYKRRPIKSEEEVLTSFLEKGLDKEDVLMMKLAFIKLRGTRNEIVEGMHWAYYPHNILSRGKGTGGRREREGKRERERERERD